MRRIVIITGCLVLAGCMSAKVPNSAAHVRTGDQFQVESQMRDAQLEGRPLSALGEDGSGPMTALPAMTEPTVTLPQVQTATATALPPISGGNSADSVAADATAIFTDPSANTSMTSSPAMSAPVMPAAMSAENTVGISDENDFNAVDGRRSIQSDAERIAQNRAQYEVVQPESLPARVDSGPNIVDYALATNHPVSVKKYSRGPLNSIKAARNKCARYASPDLAQSAFLSNGGPQRDKMGLDPDGDGYACSWDPSAFRKALGG